MRWFFASLLMALQGCSAASNPLLVWMFGPPATSMHEAYKPTGTTTIDHSLLDLVVKKHVKNGLVDYKHLLEDRGVLQKYLKVLAAAPLGELSRDERLALDINAYNAFTLQLILENYPLKSIKDIPSKERWDAVRWELGGEQVSLTSLEHEELRSNFVEPRIHFAINCASLGCPPLRAEAYAADRIEEQLADQTQTLLNDPRWVQVTGNTVSLTPLFLWFQGDFESTSGTVLQFVEPLRSDIKPNQQSIRWIDYDWSLNEI